MELDIAADGPRARSPRAPALVPAAERPGVTVTLRRLIHGVLTHPATMAAKSPVKDLLWTIRGRALRNPPFDREVRSVLFLCHGNICRSPFAAARAAHLLEQAGLRDVQCASAGIAANQANQCPPEACDAATAFGISLGGHAPILLTQPMMDEFDLIVVMEAAQMRLLQQRFERAASRVLLLALLDGEGRRGYARYNIADPFGQPRTAFDDCYRRIDRALHSLVERLRTGRLQPRADAPAAAR
jgi:protein-tyrosine-phosphatase